MNEPNSVIIIMRITNSGLGKGPWVLFCLFSLPRTRLLDEQSMASRRLPYFRDGQPRPMIRGLFMSQLTSVWPALTTAHFAICAALHLQFHRSRSDLLACRLLVACATIANVIISDRYHNGDCATKPSLSAEIFWLRLDFIGISAVLSSTFALWAAHFQWADPFGGIAAASAAATGCVACVAYGLYERDSRLTCDTDPSGECKPGILPGIRSRIGEKLIKAVLGLQYVAFFGYMVAHVLRQCPPCGPHTVIWFTYLPGFVSYVLQVPKDSDVFGAHDVFHFFVLLGHVASACCDAIAVRWDCSVECLDTSYG